VFAHRPGRMFFLTQVEKEAAGERPSACLTRCIVKITASTTAPSTRFAHYQSLVKHHNAKNTHTHTQNPQSFLILRKASSLFPTQMYSSDLLFP
jgi:hypothetical protein